MHLYNEVNKKCVDIVSLQKTAFDKAITIQILIQT